MVIQLAKYLEIEELKTEEMRRYDFFLLCEKCRYVWDRKGFDYANATFTDPDVCPCCSNDWATPFISTGKAPSKEKGDPEAWSPVTEEVFVSRQVWLDFQREKRISKGNPLLPVSLEEYKKNKDLLIQQREEFFKKLESQQIDKHVVFKMQLKNS